MASPTEVMMRCSLQNHEFQPFDEHQIRFFDFENFLEHPHWVRQLHNIWHSCFKSDDKHYKNIRHARYIVFSLDRENRLQGYNLAVQHLTPELSFEEEAVLPDARGKRLGQQLLNAMLYKLKSLGFSSITLKCEPDRSIGTSGQHKLGDLYKSFGFEEVPLS